MQYPKDIDIRFCPCCSSDNVRLEQLDNWNSVWINCYICEFYTAVDVVID